MRIREVEGEVGDRPADRAVERASLDAYDRPQRAARVACHLVAELPFLLVALMQIAQGWRPTLDDAAISIRSWAVLTSRSPQLGEFTQATRCARHVAWNPGPLQFWALALPVRLDPAHGVLWGAAVCCMVAMAICVEAAWAVRGAAATVAVGAFAVVLTATQPDMLVNSAWDPHFGLVWFAATCMAAWAVGTGRLGWWPVLVLTASIAAQTHLAYALGAALLAILAPVAGILRRPGMAGGWAWLPVGLAVGAACWTVPVVQQLTGHPGNVSVLLRCVGGRLQTMGGRFGLATIGSAVVPPPLWFHQPSGGVHALLHSLTVHSAGDGIAVLVVLAVVAVVGWLLQRRDLAVLCGVALVAACSAALEIAGQPVSVVVSLFDADLVLWPVGMLVWGVAVLSVAEVVSSWGEPALRGVRHRRSSEHRWRGQAPRRTAGERATAAFLWGSTAVLFVGATVNAGIIASGAMNRAVEAAGGSGTFRGVSVGAAEAERLVPRGPLVITVSGPYPNTSLDLLYGTLWILISHGRNATAPGIFAETISPPAHAVPGEPWVDLVVRADGSVAGASLTSGSLWPSSSAPSSWRT